MSAMRSARQAGNGSPHMSFEQGKPGSRAAILGQLRERLGRTAGNAAEAGRAISRRLHQRPAGPRSRLPSDAAQLEALFVRQAESLASTVHMLASLDEVPAAVAAYLGHHGLPLQAVIWPAWAGLNWSAAGLHAAVRPVTGNDAVGITGVFAAIAETGSLVLCSGVDTPAATSLLPETHIAVVPRVRLVPDMEAAWALLRHERVVMPRAVNLVSGPSRTGDIEQTIVLGAHGPARLHMLLVP